MAATELVRSGRCVLFFVEPVQISINPICIAMHLKHTPGELECISSAPNNSSITPRAIVRGARVFFAKRVCGCWVRSKFVKTQTMQTHHSLSVEKKVFVARHCKVFFPKKKLRVVLHRIVFFVIEFWFEFISMPVLNSIIWKQHSITKKTI